MSRCAPSCIRLEGALAFQEYFVGRRCEVAVTGFTFDGVERARPTEEVRAALQHPALAAIVICPSNPFVSIDPILAVPELRDLLRARNVPVVAVSPIIGGAAVKGPAAKMMRELGREVSAAAVAAYYRGLAHGVVIDEADAGLAAQIEAMEMAVRIVPTLMRSSADRRDLALACLDFARYLASGAAAQ